MDGHSAHVCIVGAGNVGRNLGRFFQRKGVIVTAFIETDPARAAECRKDFPHNVVSENVTWIPPATNFILLCLPDHQIQLAAEQLVEAGVPSQGCVVAHTSGIRTSEDIAPIAALGAITGSMHPAQSFPSPRLSHEYMEGIGCGLEGSAAFLAEMEAFAFSLGWKAVHIPTEQKALYHAACVVAGNFIPMLAAHAMVLLAAATKTGDGGIDYLYPMMQSVISNVKERGIIASLTGPAIRNDNETLDRHRSALGLFDPELVELYNIFTNQIKSLRDTTRK